MELRDKIPANEDCFVFIDKKPFDNCFSLDDAYEELKLMGFNSILLEGKIINRIDDLEEDDDLDFEDDTPSFDEEEWEDSEEDSDWDDIRSSRERGEYDGSRSDVYCLICFDKMSDTDGEDIIDQISDRLDCYPTMIHSNYLQETLMEMGFDIDRATEVAASLNDMDFINQNEKVFRQRRHDYVISQMVI